MTAEDAAIGIAVLFAIYVWRVARAEWRKP